MWCSWEESDQINSNTEASTSSASSCPSPFSPLLPAQKRKTMVEVWKDISLNTLHQRPDGDQMPVVSGAGFRSFVFQDFLAGPVKDNLPGAVTAHDADAMGLVAPSPPPTALCLKSGPQYQWPNAAAFRSPILASSPAPAPAPVPFDTFRSSAPVAYRGPLDPGRSFGDRRHRRMIKNRESAARSRARKQAYTNELELEVAYLLEENAKLKAQQQQQKMPQQFYVAAAATSSQFSRKQSLQRTLTAPF